MGLCNDAGRRTGKTIDSPEAKAILNNQGVCNLQKKMGEFHTLMQIMQEKALLFGKIYLAGKDFARSPVMTVATYVWYDLWYNGRPKIQTLPKSAKIKLPKSAKSHNCISHGIF